MRAAAKVRNVLFGKLLDGSEMGSFFAGEQPVFA
jgi:hypothetical protein